MGLAIVMFISYIPVFIGMWLEAKNYEADNKHKNRKYSNTYADWES